MFDNTFIIAFAGILGGVGVFLLAISLLTQGLQMVSGNALRKVLEKWTNSPLRGLGLGLGVTALLQSSSAVTALTIGLVNASVVTLGGAIWVIFGANVGTTMTGWLVSLTGFDFDIKSFALPFIGAGMLMKTFAQGSLRLNAIGTALTGFGLFFVGIDILKEAFAFFAAQPQFQSVEYSGFVSLFLLIGAGFVMTVMTQSSSAAIALILTGTASGMMNLTGGAALVIGANLGTTSTAVLSALGASSNAKRTAAAHVMFNAITATIALFLLPLLLMSVAALEDLLNIPTTPVVSLALFHTVFNITGVIILSPFVGKLSRFLEHRFISPIERDGKPEFLDTMSLNMPALAVHTLVQELQRFKTLACDNAINAFTGTLDGRTSALQNQKREALSTLSGHISSFAGNLAQAKTAEDITTTLNAALRVNRYLRELSLLSIHARDTRILLREIKDENAIKTTEDFLKKCAAILTGLSHDVPLSESILTDFIEDYHKTKDALLQAGAQKKLPIEDLSNLLDHLSPLRRMIEQAIKATRHLELLKGA